MKLAASCLQMDVGNSSVKWRLLRDGEMRSRGRYQSDDVDSRATMLACCAELEQVWVSSVASTTAEASLTRVLEGQWGVAPWFARTQGQTAGLRNSYAEPVRMGVDRWLVMLAARQRLRGRLCVVDAGSALTIDIVDAGGRHEGGYIIPGSALMERALLLDTDRVRFEEQVVVALDPGLSTAEAVRHGCALAQVGAVRLALQRAGIHAATQLLFCGGGGENLMQLLGMGGGFAPDLVFEGLQLMADTQGGRSS